MLVTVQPRILQQDVQASYEGASGRYFWIRYFHSPPRISGTLFLKHNSHNHRKGGRGPPQWYSGPLCPRVKPPNGRAAFLTDGTGSRARGTGIGKEATCF